MGIIERKEREKEERRNSIIDAAENVFFSKGVANSTMDEVAEAAELSKGTIYLYFKHKDDLFHGIIHRAMLKLEGVFKKVSSEEGSGAERLTRIGEAYFKFSDEYPDYFDAMLHQEEKHLFENGVNKQGYFFKCNEVGNSVFSILANIIRDGIKDGSLRPDIDPMKHAIALWGHTTGIMQIIKSKGHVLERIAGITGEELINYSFDLIRRCSRNVEK